jgi:tripartite-type tricarboxylate transporter receptor subunit TctC
METLVSLKHLGSRLLAGLICAAPIQAVKAQTVEEFYKGKTLSLVIPNAPGGSFDL